MHERDLAYQLAIKPNSPGFGYMVNHGELDALSLSLSVYI